MAITKQMKSLSRLSLTQAAAFDVNNRMLYPWARNCPALEVRVKKFNLLHTCLVVASRLLHLMQLKIGRLRSRDS